MRKTSRLTRPMHQKPLLLLSLVALAIPAFASAPDGGVTAEAKAKPEVPVGPLKTADDKALYVFGYSVARNWEALNLSKAEQEIVKKGVADALAGQKPLVPLQDYGPRLQSLVQTRPPLAAAARVKKDQPVLDKAAKEKGAQVSATGLVYVPLTEGTGAQPKATDLVKVNYKGSLADGTEFDSSYKRGQPAEFALDKVVACWGEGVQRMKVGGKAKLVCPASIAYKDKGAPQAGIPGGAVLTFEVELLEVKPPPPPAPAPTPGAMPATPK
jgi:FKBP-type peptidyl-prolyl cis-trans isomerase FkpA